MASTKEYLDFILEQLSDLDEISFRAMMGEYIIYYRGKVVGGIYDDRFLVKPTKSAMEMMPNADMEQPYDGAKQMILVDDVDNRGVMYRLIQAIWEDLPNRELKFVVEFYKKDLVPKYDIPEL
jgi:TfoX/Sxy family transcriptional regulator of competence genes